MHHHPPPRKNSVHKFEKREENLEVEKLLILRARIISNIIATTTHRQIEVGPLDSHTP